MRSRAKRGHTNIQVAVIDLDVCRAKNPAIPFASGIAHDGPCIHALSGLLDLDDKYPRFANMADEILVYDNIPADAIISIVCYEKIFPLLPAEFQDSLPPSPPEFRVFHDQCARRLANGGKWDPEQRGEMSAEISLLLLGGAYTKLSTLIIASSVKETRIKPSRLKLEGAVSG